MKFSIFLFIVILFGITTNAQVVNFEQKLLYNHIYGLKDACTADLDNDGDLDIIIAEENKISWIENLLVGKFGIKQTISTDVDNVMAIYVEDLDGDGDMDIMSASIDDHKIAWYENLGDRNFGDQIIVPTYAYISPRDIHATDLNGDGLIDILSASGSSVISWNKNLGDGNFSYSISLTEDLVSPNNLSTADLDGDGDTDILAADFSLNKIIWFENIGDSLFSEEILITDSIGAGSIDSFAGDFDNDGNIDVAVVGNTNPGWYRNTGDGTFEPIIYFPEFYAAFKINGADVDLDGDIDLFTRVSSGVGFFENLGEGVFASPIILAGYMPLFLILEDLNEDGLMDLLSANMSGGFSGFFWYEQIELLSFSEGKLIASKFDEAEWVHIVDFDEDGDDDLLTSSGNKVSYIEAINPGKFANPLVLHNYIPLTRSVATGDLDGDGDLDIVTTSIEYSDLMWIENLGDNNYSEAILIDGLVLQTNRAIVDDIDGDGDMDILLRYFSCGFMCTKTVWYENLGDAVFASKVEIVVTNPRSKTTLLEDINEDGKPDVINYFGTNISWNKNLGEGEFSSQIMITNDAGTSTAGELADLDGDGDKEIIGAVSSNILYFDNLGGGEFATVPNTVTVYGGAKFIEATDINSDGKIDLVYGQHSAIGWCQNLGDGSFGTQEIITTDVLNLKRISSTDFDFDGDFDLVSASYTDDKIAWYENKLYDRKKLRGLIYFDADSSGTKDSSEIGIDFVQVITDPENIYSFTHSDGRFVVTINANSGDVYELTPDTPLNWSVTTDPSMYAFMISDDVDSIDGLDFGIRPNDTTTNELSVSLVGSIPRCDWIVNHWVSYRNIGTTAPNGTIILELDDSITYINCENTPDSIVGQKIYWHYNDLYYFEKDSFRVEVKMPTNAMLDETMTSYLIISTVESGETVYTKEDSLNQTLICTYTPNDKIAAPAGIGELGEIPPTTEYLDYTIRFQNTGNDTVTNVTIIDLLDPDLNWVSLSPISSSHAMTVDINYLGEVEFFFSSIMLPDSATDFLGSQGYVKYRIELNEDLPLGTDFHNTAEIYFDANLPIISNTKINTLVCSNIVTIEIEGEVDVIVCDHTDSLEIIPSRYGGVLTGSGISGFLFHPEEAGIGSHIIYYEIEDPDGCSYDTTLTVSVVDCLTLEEENNYNISIYPNPFSKNLTITFGKVLEKKHSLVVYDLIGKQQIFVTNIIGDSYILSNNYLSKGIYLLQMFNNESGRNIYTTKIIVE